MRIVERDEKIIQELRRSGLSNLMKSLESCDFWAIEEMDGKIVGACGVGGLFNVPSLQIDPKYQGKGLGKVLFKTVVDESKKRNYSFLAGSRNPENLPVIKIEDELGFYSVFRIHYSPGMTRDIVIMILKRKGKLVAKFLNIFNNLIGISILACVLKITKPLFRSFLTYPPEEFPDPSVTHIIKNFKKI